MKIKVNDNVLILTGKDKGKTGKVIKTLKNEQKVVVEGINTTASKQSVAVSYGIFNNKMLTGFNFKNFDFEANGQKIICDYPIGPVENISGLEIKGFVWDNMSNMIPQCGFVELKPTAQE